LCGCGALGRLQGGVGRSHANPCPVGKYDTSAFHLHVADPYLSEGGTHYLYLFSAGRGASTGQEFTLYTLREEIPEVGRYPLTRFKGTAFEWYARFTVIRGDSIDFYTAAEGYLEITASSAERIKGHFTFDSVHDRTCATIWKNPEIVPGTTPVPPCAHSEIAEQPTIRIHGSFGLANGGRCPREVDAEWSASPWYRSFMDVCTS
jgi:hypothetical protein